jgi:bifunctional DNA primase/polymerase-like protein
VQPIPTDPYDQAVDRLIANGYCPLALNGKSPIEAEWPRQWHEAPTPEQIAARNGCGHNIGVALGCNQVVAIDIDTDEAAINGALREAVPASNVVKRGRVGSTGFYRVEGQLPSGRTFRGKDGQILVELLSDGRQAAIPPSVHPDTGRPYQWLTTATLCDTPADRLVTLPADIGVRIERALAPWLGSGDLFPDLTWTNRPDMTGSDAPGALQDIWVAVMLAMRATMGAIKPGKCFVTAFAALPVIQARFDETAVACAGYAGFVDEHGRGEFGFRWRPEKWANWVDANGGMHLSPLQDVHTWIETATHIIDLSTGDEMSAATTRWPPLMYRPKWQMPKHPREARCEKPGERKILLWRNAAALAIPTLVAEPVAAPITARAMEILDG